MAITYTWKVTNLKKIESVDGLSNVAVHARWTRTGVDENGHEGTFQGATPLRLPESGSGTFTDWNDITEAQVIEWIKGEVASNHGYEDHIVSQIMKQINAKKNPVIDVELLPWGVQAVGVGSTPAVSASAGAAASASATPRYYDIDGMGM